MVRFTVAGPNAQGMAFVKSCLEAWVGGFDMACYEWASPKRLTSSVLHGKLGIAFAPTMKFVVPTPPLGP